MTRSVWACPMARTGGSTTGTGSSISSRQHVYLVYFVCLIGKDLGYYWYHRTLHEFHLLWSAHSVHHSGEDYNIATGLRQGVLQPLFVWPFYLPCAFLGIHPHTFAAHAQLNTLYMLWIHTDIVNRLPWPLEHILNSPMAHRMHHRPPGNCNYGGLLIVWDRVFGTYQAETVRKTCTASVGSRIRPRPRTQHPAL